MDLIKLKNDYIDEDIVSSVINFLFLNKDKFSEMTFFRV